MTTEQVAEAAQIDVALLQAVEREETVLAKGKVLKLARALAVPVQFLFFRQLRIEPNLPDFRTPKNRPAVLTGGGLSRVERAKSIVSYLDDEIFEDEHRIDLAGTISLGDNINDAAKSLSVFWKPKTRSEGGLDPSGTFRETRLSLEKAGAIVLCDTVANDSFRGFCYSKPGKIPLILINTSQQKPETKLFTLMHEIVHVLLGRTGVSDPDVLSNRIERFSNRVAAAVMMPEDDFVRQFSRFQNKNIRSTTNALAHYFGVSKSAAALRVTDLRLSEDYYKRWLSKLTPSIPEIEEEDDEKEAKSGGGGIPAQVGRFGYRLPSMLGRAVTNRSISVYDAYRLTNLSPPTFRQVAAIGQNRLEH